MRRVLVIAPAWVGDMVMAQTVVESCRRRGAEIDVLAPRSVAPIATRMPGVRAVIDFPSRHGYLDLAMRWRVGRDLAGAGYDAAFVLPNTFKSALVPLFARIPRRIGFVGEMRGVLLTRAVELDPERWPRMVDRYAALADEPACRPRLTADAGSRARLMDDLGLDGDFVALCMGGEYGPAKRWPEHRYAALARDLDRRGLATVLMGGPNDAESASVIAAHSPARNAIGTTTLADAVDLLSGAKGVVSNDTGLMHVAAALGRPVAAIFGSTTPAFTPPLSDDALVIERQLDCRPCFARVCPLGHTHCLTKIEPSSVIRSLERLGVC